MVSSSAPAWFRVNPRAAAHESTRFTSESGTRNEITVGGSACFGRPPTFFGEHSESSVFPFDMLTRIVYEYLRWQLMRTNEPFPRVLLVAASDVAGFLFNPVVKANPMANTTYSGDWE